MSEDLISVEEAATILGMRPHRLRRIAREGQVPSVKIGKYRVFSRKEIQKLKGVSFDRRRHDVENSRWSDE